MFDLSPLECAGLLGCGFVLGASIGCLLVHVLVGAPPPPKPWHYVSGTHASYRWVALSVLGEPAEVLLVPWVRAGYIEVTVAVPWWRALVLWARWRRLTAALEADCAIGTAIKVRHELAWRMAPVRERARASEVRP